MSEPKVTTVREVGRTTDSHRLSVKVERTAWLDERLTLITGRSTGRIHLVAHDGFADAQVWHLDPEQAKKLLIGLENAIDDLREAESWVSPDDTPTHPTTRTRREGAGEGDANG